MKEVAREPEPAVLESSRLFLIACAGAVAGAIRSLRDLRSGGTSI
jgi:hypothetical protein